MRTWGGNDEFQDEGGCFLGAAGQTRRLGKLRSGPVDDAEK
jgi:hypothetical protein